MRSFLLLPALLLASACAGSQVRELGTPPARQTTATPAPSARCHGGACSCRAPGDDVESTPPAAGLKRFELRIDGTNDPMWATLDGVGTIYRPPEPGGETCFYLDLPSGPHTLHFRAMAQDPAAGMNAVLHVSEYGPAARHWYDTFDLSCGGESGPCGHDAMMAWTRRVDAIPHGVNDRCGTTRFRHVVWSGTRASPADDRLVDVGVDVELGIEPMAPSTRPGCPQPVAQQ